MPCLKNVSQWNSKCFVNVNRIWEWSREMKVCVFFLERWRGTIEIKKRLGGRNVNLVLILPIAIFLMAYFGLFYNSEGDVGLYFACENLKNFNWFSQFFALEMMFWVKVPSISNGDLGENILQYSGKSSVNQSSGKIINKFITINYIFTREKLAIAV